VAGCIPYAGTQRLSYDFFKSGYMARKGQASGVGQVGGADAALDPPLSVSFTCGLLSSCLAMTVSYPFILVRTRLQVSLPSRAPFPLLSLPPSRPLSLSPSPSLSPPSLSLSLSISLPGLLPRHVLHKRAWRGLSPRYLALCL